MKSGIAPSRDVCNVGGWKDRFWFWSHVGQCQVGLREGLTGGAGVY